MTTPRKHPVRDFRCTKCGLRIKGVRRDDGVIYATNRPHSDAIVEDCTCMACVEQPAP